MKRDWTAKADEWIDKTEDGKQIFGRFCEVAIRIFRRGGRAGAKSIAEYVRWNLFIDGVSDEAYKVNNNYTTRLAQRCVLRIPELNGFFKFRSSFRPLVQIDLFRAQEAI